MQATRLLRLQLHSSRSWLGPQGVLGCWSVLPEETRTAESHAENLRYNSDECNARCRRTNGAQCAVRCFLRYWAGDVGVWPVTRSNRAPRTAHVLSLHAADLTASGPVPSGVCPSFAGCAGGSLLDLNGPRTSRTLAHAPISSALSLNR